MTDLREFRVECRGFDTYICRARSSSAARFASWKAFREAGYKLDLLAFEKITRITVVERRRSHPGPDFAQLTALADEGLSRSDIAAITGWSVQTVGRHVGHLVPARRWSAKPDVARYRRMIKAVAAAEYGQRDAIARRFGLKDARSLKVTLVTARRRVAEADQISEGAKS